MSSEVYKMRLRPNSDQVVGIRSHGQGETVLMIHGVGLQSAAWHPQIANLSKSHRVIAVDLPGHGASTHLCQVSQLEDYVAWLQSVVAALDLSHINVVGHSLGALIAAGFAIQNPSLTRRVALLNGVYLRDMRASETVFKRANEIREGKIDIETPLRRWFGSSQKDVAARREVAEWLSEVDSDGYAKAYMAFALGDKTYADRFASISCPFLAVTGNDDPNSTPAMSLSMARATRDGQVIVVPGHRHMVNLTAPGEVTSYLRKWLERPARDEETE